MNSTEKIDYCDICQEYQSTCKGCKMGYLDGSRDLNLARYKMKKCYLARGRITWRLCGVRILRDHSIVFQSPRLQIHQVQASTGIHPHPRPRHLLASGGELLERCLRQVPGTNALNKIQGPLKIRKFSAVPIFDIATQMDGADGQKNGLHRLPSSLLQSGRTKWTTSSC